MDEETKERLNSLLAKQFMGMEPGTVCSSYSLVWEITRSPFRHDWFETLDGLRSEDVLAELDRYPGTTQARDAGDIVEYISPYPLPNGLYRRFHRIPQGQQRGTPPASIYLSTGWLSCETFINVELLWGYGHARYDFTVGYAKRGLKADRDLSRSEVESLLSAFQASRAWEWETHYKNPGVLDGEHWSLLVRYADGYAFESEGSNNWPDEFLVIYEAMRDLGMMRYGRAGELPGYYRRYDPSERNYILQ